MPVRAPLTPAAMRTRMPATKKIGGKDEYGRRFAHPPQVDQRKDHQEDEKVDGHLVADEPGESRYQGLGARGDADRHRQRIVGEEGGGGDEGGRLPQMMFGYRVRAAAARLALATCA